MPDQIDPSLDQLSQQRWGGPPPQPGATHGAPQPDPVAGTIQGFTRPGGGIQAAIEGAGGTPPQWLVGANDWLSRHKGVIEAVKNVSEGLPGPTELGMFKFIPAGNRITRSLNRATDRLPTPQEVEPGHFMVFDHNDVHVADIENAYIDKKGNLHLDIFSSHARDSKYPPGHPAREANRASHIFPAEELAEMARAGLREFPGLKSTAEAYGLRISGSRSRKGPASAFTGTRPAPPQRIPIERLIKRYPEKFPAGSEPNMFPDNMSFSDQLLDLALQSIKKPPSPKASQPFDWERMRPRDAGGERRTPIPRRGMTDEELEELNSRRGGGQ